MRYRVYNRFETLGGRLEKRFSNVTHLAEYYKDLSLGCEQNAKDYLEENEEMFCYYKYKIAGDELEVKTFNDVIKGMKKGDMEKYDGAEYIAKVAVVIEVLIPGADENKNENWRRDEEEQRQDH